MPDKEQAHLAGEDEGVRKVDLEISQRLIALGFNPAIPVYDTNKGFDPDIVRDAILGGVHSDPALIEFEWAPWHKGSSPCTLRMEVELIQVVWVPCSEEDAQTLELDFYEEPEWYLRGWLGVCDLNPSAEIIRMHAYISQMIDIHGDLDPSGWLQVLREQPSREQPFSRDGQLIRGTNYPVIT